MTTNNREENRRIAQFNRTIRNHLFTSRFNDETKNRNAEYRATKIPKGCLYGAPYMITRRVSQGTNIMVLEMNNDTNQIFGIGLIKNIPYYNKYRLYNDKIDGFEDYNRYVYVGKYHIKRDEMTEKEEEVMKVFDELCFKGHMHMKRGQGLRAFPLKILWRTQHILDLRGYVEKMFKRRFFKKEPKKEMEPHAL